MELVDIKTVKITDKGQIAIPRDIRALKGFEKGKKVTILAYNDHMEIRPLSSVTSLDMRKDTFEATLLSEKILAKDWLTKKEDEAWKNL